MSGALGRGGEISGSLVVCRGWDSLPCGWKRHSSGPAVNRGQDNRHSHTTKTDNPVSPHSSHVAIRHFKGS